MDKQAREAGAERVKVIRLEDGGAMGTHIVIEGQPAAENAELRENTSKYDKSCGRDEHKNASS